MITYVEIAGSALELTPILLISCGLGKKVNLIQDLHLIFK